MPLGQIWIREFNDVKLPQSSIIARFLAKQFQLAVRENFEQAKFFSEELPKTFTKSGNYMVMVVHYLLVIIYDQLKY
jgi:hypothetical protein